MSESVFESITISTKHLPWSINHKSLSFPLSFPMNRKKEIQTPQSVTSRFLVEFLEVAITSIIFLKSIYPIGAFERRRYMNLVVHRARNPQLSYYINHSLNILLPYIQQGMVEKVAVIFFNRKKIPIEKFVFKVNVNQTYTELMEDADYESPLRSFLNKLSQSEPLSKTVSKDWNWEITGYFRSLPGAMKDDETLISTETQHWQQPPVITPVKSMNLEPVSVQLYLEHLNHMESNP